MRHTLPHLVLILTLLLPATQATAQARADSERYQNNHMSQPHKPRRQTPQTQQWPQDQPRTQLFCDQYARAASGQRGATQGSQTGTELGQGLGYIGTRDKKQAEAFGMIGGAVGASAGTEMDQQFIAFHFDACMRGDRLGPTSK